MKPLLTTWLPLILGSALLTAAFQQTDPGDGLHSGILKQNMDTTVNPGDNFTEFVNGNWAKKTSIPADRATYGTMAILYDKSQDDVKTIIEDAAKANPADGSEEQKIGDFYESYLNMKARDAIGLEAPPGRV